jgi:putative RNA 2'-phosphotransferase
MSLPKSDTEVSKNISYHLRHNPEELNIKLDIEGWVRIEELIVSYNQKYNTDPDKSKV